MRKTLSLLSYYALALFFIVSCSKDEETIPPAKYAIDLSAKDYGNVEVEATASQTFKITNRGGMTLFYSRLRLKTHQNLLPML